TLLLLLWSIMTTINKIKAMLVAGTINPSYDDVIKTGTLIAADGQVAPYTLHQGWDIAKCFACDDKWGEFNVRLLNYIDSQKYDQATRDKVLSEIQMDDSHWEWFKKACYHKDTSFNWFFLMSNGLPQGISLYTTHSNSRNARKVSAAVLT
ncbi:MAG: hypothetical protein AAB834_07955, partial [Patescibacteria group bacterium]